MKTGSSVELQSSRGGYVSQSAVALRCRVMPPPCLKNPYVKNASDFDVDPFSNQRSKCAGAHCYYVAFIWTKEAFYIIVDANYYRRRPSDFISENN